MPRSGVMCSPEPKVWSSWPRTTEQAYGAGSTHAAQRRDVLTRTKGLEQLAQNN
jgi:hypothetical protein